MVSAPFSLSRLCAVAVLVVLSLPARAQQLVPLGDGVVLSYASGNLDSSTLAGTAEEVQVLIDDAPVAAIGRLRLVTRGALVDPDFTITELEADNILGDEGRMTIDAVSGNDLPLGSLRILAGELKALDAPAPADVYRFIGKVTLGRLTVTGARAEDDQARIGIGRLSVRGVGGGTAKLVELLDGSLADKTAGLDVSVKAVRLTDLSLDPRVFAGFDLEALALLSDEVNVTVAAASSHTDAGQLDDGTPYPARGVVEISDLIVLPGQAPSAGTRAFFADLGQAGLKMSLDGESVATPSGGNLDIGSTLRLTAQTGDGLRLASRWQMPITSWQIFAEATLKNPLDPSPDAAMQMLANLALVDADIEITAAGVADAVLAGIARDGGTSVEEMRRMITEDATGALGALPDGGAAFRDAVTAFIARSGTLRLMARPAYPFPLSVLLAADQQLDAIWDKLNLSASHEER